MIIMRMTELATLLMESAKTFGDKEVVLMEEGTGEIRYVEAISFDTGGDTVMLEHIDFGEKQLVDMMNSLDVDNEVFEYENPTAVVPMNLMEIMQILGGVE